MSDMKNALKIFAHIFMIILGYYLFFSLLCWSLNTSEWHGFTRCIFGLLSLGTIGIYLSFKYS